MRWTLHFKMENFTERISELIYPARATWLCLYP